MKQNYGCVILGRISDNYVALNKLGIDICLNENTFISTYLDDNNLKYIPIQTYNYYANSIQGFFLEDNFIVGVVVSTK